MMKKITRKLKKAIKWYFDQNANSNTCCPSGMIPLVNKDIKTR